MTPDRGRIGITCYPTVGGSGIIATELGIELARRGWKVHFISSRTPRRLSAFHEGVFTHEVEPMQYPLFEHTPFDLALAVKQAEVVRSFDLDLLHVHYAIPFATSAYLARQMLMHGRSAREKPLRIVTTLHGTDITLVGRDPSYFDITCFSLEVSDGLTGVSDYLVEETRKLFALNSPIERIYNFVDTQEYRPDAPGACLDPEEYDEEPILLHISNFREVKRIPDLMDIFLRVNARKPCHLVLLGEGPELARALGIAREKGVAERVHAMGKQESPACFLAQAHLLLLPSKNESFGLVALESLACGTPVIGTRAGGLPEVVRDGVDGFLEEVGDTAAMAERALELLGDREKMQVFGEAGRQRAIADFGRSRIVDQYEAYYQRVLSG